MFELYIKPAFCNTDALGHISNTVIPEWFESARDPVFKLFSPDLNPKSWNLILAKYEIVFHTELFYGTDVLVKTWISHLGNSSIHVKQQLCQNNKLAVEGTTVLVHFNHDTKKSSSIPSLIKAQLSEHLIPQEHHFISD